MADDELEDFTHPRHTERLLSHEGAEQELLKALQTGKLHHAWLLTGPRGIGKATMAYRFARFLFVHGQDARGSGPSLFGEALPEDPPSSLYIDPESRVFRRVASGGHSDLMSIERRVDEKTGRRKAEIAIDDVRSVKAFLSLTAGEGGARIVIIDAVDELNRNAANAVLKVLEEPPPGAILLLVCHSPGRLLPTITSRCRKLSMSPLPRDMIVSEVKRRLPEIAPEAAETAAILANGGLGRALEIGQGDGLDVYAGLTRLIAQMPDPDIPSLHAFATQMAGAGREASFETFRDLICWWLERFCVWRSGGELAPGIDRAAAERLAERGPLERWLAVWDNTRQMIGRGAALNLDKKQIVIDVMLRINRAAAP